MTDIENIRDRLSERGRNQKDFEEKVDILNKLAYDLRTQQPEKAISISKVALETSEKINYRKGIAHATFNAALANLKLENYEEAKAGFTDSIKYFKEVNDIALEGRAIRGIARCDMLMFNFRKAIEPLVKSVELFDKAGEDYLKASSLEEIASSYYELHDFALSLEFYLKSYEVYEKLDNKHRISTIYNKIANINLILNEREEALEYYHKSIDLKREIGDKTNEALSLMNIGLIYFDESKYPEALKYFNMAQAINIEIGEKVNEATCNINIAEVLIKQEEFEEAEKRLDMAKEILEPTKFEQFKAATYITYGRLYAAKKEFYEAIHFVNDAYEIAQKIEETKILLDALESYSNCYLGLEDFEKAHEYFRKYYDVKNERYTKEMHEKIKNMQYKYERETALKEAETQKKRGEELEKALSQVEELNENLKKMNEEKNTFMALVAHDLKNPLNAIMGYAQLARVNPLQFGDEELTDMFNDIEVSARIMSELITNYLEYTTIEAGRVHLDMKEVDICNIAGYVMDSFKSRGHSKNIAIELIESSPSINIFADKNALTQILDNLVSNAVKFSRSGTTVTINIDKHDNLIRCSVVDEGPGISKEDQKKLFKKFSRLTAKPTAGESSTGLGLSISKRLTEDMNGTIRCESEEGKGTSFIVEFPAMN